MATFTKFRPFVSNLAAGKFNFTSDSTCTVTVALCAAANAPVNTNAALSELTQVAYTNLSTRVVTGITCTQTTGTMHLTADDLVLTASGTVATFRYVVIYDDDSTTDLLIGWYDHGSNVSLANGETYTIDFATDIFTIA